MHELAITNKIISIIISECQKKKITKPKKVIIELGEMTGFKKEPIEYYFDILKKERNADLISIEHQNICRDELFYKISLLNLKLEIFDLPGKIFCKECNQEKPILDHTMIFCPDCDSSNFEIIQGDDCIVKKIIA